MRIATTHRATPISLDVPRPEYIQATYLSRRMFLEHVTVGPEQCRFYWPTSATLPAGTAVRVDLGFSRDLERFHFAGKVIRSREDLTRPARSGLLIEVSDDDLLRFGRGYAFARGNPMDFGRRHASRTPCRFEGQLELSGVASPVRLADLSRGGAFVETRLKAIRGAHVHLSFKVGLFSRVRASARVAWCGTRADVPGLGLEFLELSPADSSRLAVVLKDLGG